MYDRNWLITENIHFIGFYSLIGRVFDCDSKCMGSSPIKNPIIRDNWI